MIDLEACLILQLTDVDSMRKFLIQPGGLKEEIIPWTDAKKAFGLASEHFLRSGGTKAVSRAVLETEMEQYLNHKRESMGEVEDEYVEPIWLVKKLQTDYFRRTMQTRLKDAAKDGTWSEDVEIEDALEKGKTLISDLSRIAVASSMDKPLAPMADTLPVWAEDVLNRHSREADGEVKTPVTFGFAEVDDAYKGLRTDELMVVGAAMKVGKSFVLCKQGLKAAEQGRTVVLWTLENSENETYARLISLAGGFSYAQISDATVPPNQREKFRDLVGDEVFNRIYVKQPRNATLEEMYYQTATLGAGLLLGDQFSFVNYKSRSGEADWERFSNIAHRAKELTLETQLPSVWATQLNREAIKKDEPGAGQIGRSIGIGQAADFFFFLSEDKNLGADKRRYSCSLVRRAQARDWALHFGFDPMRIEVDREIAH